MVEEIGLVLIRLRELARKTQEEVAEAISSSQTVVSRHEREGKVSRKTLEKYAKFYDVPVDVILGNQPIANKTAQIKANINDYLANEEYYLPEPIVLLPLYEEASAGSPCFVDERPVDRRPVDSSRVSHDLPNYILVRVHGESMIQKGIMPGSMVLVHRQSHVEDGQTAIIRIGADGVTIKRVRFIANDKVMLIPENQTMREEIFNLEDITICGRVVQVITDIE